MGSFKPLTTFLLLSLILAQTWAVDMGCAAINAIQYQCTVPSGVYYIQVEVVGAKGGAVSQCAGSCGAGLIGGYGGRAQAYINVYPGEVLSYWLGGEHSMMSFLLGDILFTRITNRPDFFFTGIGRQDSDGGAGGSGETYSSSISIKGGLGSMNNCTGNLRGSGGL